VWQLESKLADLRSQLVEPPIPQPPAEPFEAEDLQEEMENLAEHLQAQVQENESLCLLNREQEEQLLGLQRAAVVWSQQAEDRKKKTLETVDND
jgi:hypothetical protein